MKGKKILIGLFLLFLILLLLFTKTVPRSALDYPRALTVESLALHNTFVLQNPSYIGDMTYDGRNWYSDKTPFFSLLGSWVYRTMLFFNPQTPPPTSPITPSISYVLITLILSGLPYLAICFLSIKELLKNEKLTSVDRLFFFSLLGGGSLLLPYATFFSNHVLTALLFLILFFYLKRNTQSIRSYLILGLTASLILSIDVILGVILIPATFIYLRWTRRERRSWWFLVGASPIFVLTVIINYAITRTVFPPSVLIKMYGALPENMKRLDIKFDPTSRIIKNIFEAFFGWHRGGIFLKTPLLIFSWYLMIVRFWKEKLITFVMLISIIYIITMVTITNDVSGVAYGFRWTVTFVPVWILILTYSWHTFSKKLRYVCYFSGFVSIWLTLIGVADPYFSAGENYTLLSLIASLFVN